ncbi:MAG: hypothetical protein ACI4E1_08560 [Lachnospira sp.]
MKKYNINHFIQNILNKSDSRKIIIIILTGVLLMLVILPTKTPASQKSNKEENVSSGTKEEVFNYEEYLNDKLSDILSKVNGVGKVEVMITFSSTSEKILAKDETYEKSTGQESDGQGGSRNNVQDTGSLTHIFYESSDGSQPYIIMENMPAISGVLIVCEGGGNASLVSEITNAASGILGVPVHRIKVLEMS